MNVLVNELDGQSVSCVDCMYTAAACIFLLHDDKLLCQGMLCVLSSLYAWHNGMRHSAGLKLGNKGFWRLALEMAHTAKTQQQVCAFKMAGAPWRAAYDLAHENE